MIDYFNEEIEVGERYYDTDIGLIKESNIKWFMEMGDIVEIMTVLRRQDELGSEPYKVEVLEALEKEVSEMTEDEFINEMYSTTEILEDDWEDQRKEEKYERQRDRLLA